MFKNIVIALDGSDYSHKALSCAKSIAERFEANLWLVHAFSTPSDYRAYTDYEKLFARRKAAAQAVLDDARQKLGHTSLVVNDELCEGPEAESILKEVDKCKADLIVMGTRGLGTLKGLLVGSISRKVIHYASCPVMVVH
jgi:nucleotide-binding universal stress UspA family protein